MAGTDRPAGLRKQRRPRYAQQCENGRCRTGARSPVSLTGRCKQIESVLPHSSTYLLPLSFPEAWHLRLSQRPATFARAGRDFRLPHTRGSSPGTVTVSAPVLQATDRLVPYTGRLHEYELSGPVDGLKFGLGPWKVGKAASAELHATV